MSLLKIHHVAIICSDYQRSKKFYTEVLGLRIVRESFREARNSFKLDLGLPDGSQIELFSFPNPPKRSSRPEAQGLRHLAFAVSNVGQFSEYLRSKGVELEEIRIDRDTNKQFTFFSDPDGLPLEIYEQ
jgi:glyoxylase I family protein